MARVKVLNNISERGLVLLQDGHEVGCAVEDPEAIIVRSARVDTDQYQSLLAVARAGAGFNNITVEKATVRGICVFNTPGANANAVAELIFTMLGIYARRIDKAFDFVRLLRQHPDAVLDRNIEAAKSQFTGFELAGKRLAVIGLGKIGVLVANAGIERGMSVVGYDAYPTITNMHQLDCRVTVARAMRDVLLGADVLTVHVPLSEKTRGLIGAEQLVLLKPGCVLMNFARGGLYDEAAVLRVLQSRQASVFITDFPTPALLADPHVLCTPHLGASTTESEENCATMAARQLRQYLDFGVATNAVNCPTVEVYPHQSTRARLTVVHRDVPGMIALVSGALGTVGINIQSLTNESNGVVGYTLIDLDADVAETVPQSLRGLENILRVRTLRFPE